MKYEEPTTTAEPSATPQPWWIRLVVKCISIIAGLFSVGLAVVGLVTFDADCLAAALLQLFIGLIMVALEAPVCCMCVEYFAKIADFSESRSDWHKAALYMFSGLIPIVICVDLSTVFGSGMIVFSGAVYGMMAIGKRRRGSSKAAEIGGAREMDAWDSNIGSQTNRPPPYSYNQP